MHRLAVAALLLLAGCSAPAEEGCTGVATVTRGVAPGLHDALSTQAGFDGIAFMHVQPEPGVPVEGIQWPEGYEGAQVLQAVRAFMEPRVDADGLADLGDGGIWFRSADGGVEVGAAIPARLDAREREEAAVDALRSLAGLAAEDAEARAPQVLAAAEVQSARIGGLQRADAAVAQSTPGTRPVLGTPLQPAEALADPANWDYVDCEAGYCQVIAGLYVMDVLFPVQTLAWSLGESRVVLEVDHEDRVQVTVRSPGHAEGLHGRLANMTLAAAGYAGEPSWHAQYRYEGQPLSHAVHGATLIECP